MRRMRRTYVLECGLAIAMIGWNMLFGSVGLPGVKQQIEGAIVRLRAVEGVNDVVVVVENRLVLIFLADHLVATNQIREGALQAVDLLGGPLRRAPVERVALIDDPVEPSDDLVHGRVRVRSASEDDVHVIEIQSFQTTSHTLDNPLARQTLQIGLVRLSTCPITVSALPPL